MKIPKTKLYYDFYRHGVTQTMINEWLNCPEACRLIYVEGWTPNKVNTNAQFFGNCVHHVLEKAYSGILLPLNGVIKCWIKDYDMLTYSEAFTAEELEEREIAFAKAFALMVNYFRIYATDFINNWEIAETIYKVPFKFDDGKQTYINGKLDGGFQAKVSNDLWLMDHKTMSQIDLDTLMMTLPYDLQINTYLWAVTQLPQYANPVGFIYNIIRNPNMKPWKRKNESVEAFESRLTEEIEKDSKRYFYRIKIPMAEIEVINWEERQLKPILRDMRRWWDTGFKWPGYFKTSGLVTKYGKHPMARILCTGDLTGYHRRKHSFSELVDIEE